LRASLTHAEALLWIHLQLRQLGDHKFRRQYSIGPYIVDFYCPAERLAIELDGAAHDYDSATDHDVARTTYLETAGVRVIRFENRDVLRNAEGVLAAIAACFGAVS